MADTSTSGSNVPLLMLPSTSRSSNSVILELVCPQCGDCFGTQDDLRRHLPIHMPKFHCTVCSKVFGHE